ncbi:MAG TPA: phospholipase D-like domain-containing protein, partial [Pyrinomonadaceae bacterium]|nr:phospholipase D-like domain-containing protein [Pyrinomonadaceae bacterium]
VLENRVSFKNAIVDAAAETIINRLKQSLATVEPCIPLVGRIDVDNYPSSLTYVGTGWLVAPNIAVTNRHVADLIARSEDGKFSFRPGRFGEQLRVSLDYRHELGVNSKNAVKVARVIWIEPDAQGPDIAFLEMDKKTDGTSLPFIPISETDARADTDVVVIGYPARAPEHIIPNQGWMDQIYGGIYDIKRIAPGLLGNTSRGWSTHDCTTLGGNSGSVVVDMKTGKAVALHFAGLYMIENYAVPASTIAKYLKDRPWHGENVTTRPVVKPSPSTGNGHSPKTSPAKQVPAVDAGETSGSGVETRLDQGQVTVTIPLTITVSLGRPQSTDTTTGTSPGTGGSTGTGTGTGKVTDIETAARELFRDHRVEGVSSVWSGYEIENGRLTDNECLVISAHPERVEDVRENVPSTFNGFPVEVRPAPVEDIMEAAGLIPEAATTSIKYNDQDRTGPGFSFNWIDENMTLDLHVGPERSWTVLSKFLKGAQNLVSSMYEFHAAHIAQAIEEDLHDGASLKLVLARQSRDPSNDEIPNGDFDRSDTFARWDENFSDRFNRIFVPLGANGLVALSYHIKVTVADSEKVWLSSGNWKRSSQPMIPSASLDNPTVTNRAGNREWHVVVRNTTLANRFGNHIKADFDRSADLGGTTESIEDQILVDVPLGFRESIETEAAPAKVLKPLRISRRVRMKPLLTPDKKGAVYSRAVLQLIRSAERQLLFQNQYIKMAGANSGFLKELVDALIEKAKSLDDCRIILRQENDSLDFDLSKLKQRGVDLERQVRVLPKTHTKGIIVDGRQVLVGSHNWSSLGVTLNRDASLIFDDEEVAQYYAEAFELDWNRSNEARVEEAVFEGVRPAEGSAPRQGFERMTLSEYLEG